MPKEITHWLVAQQVASSLQDTALGSLAAEYPNCLRLGAVLPDVPYYARRSEYKQTMRRCAADLHNTDSAFTSIADMITTAAQARHGDAVRAMVIGMLTHLATDTCFHPLICHETGDYSDSDTGQRSRSVQLHRRFETTLDIYLAGTMENIRTFSLKRIMRACELRVASLLSEAFSVPGMSRSMLHSLKVFRRMQALFAQPASARTIGLLYPLLPSAARDAVPLFYLPQFIRAAPDLHAPRTYTDPDTGAPCTVTMFNLFQHAISTSTNLCRELEGALLGTEPFCPPRLPGASGRTLETDPAVPATEPHHA